MLPQLLHCQQNTNDQHKSHGEEQCMYDNKSAWKDILDEPRYTDPLVFRLVSHTATLNYVSARLDIGITFVCQCASTLPPAPAQTDK